MAKEPRQPRQGVAGQRSKKLEILAQPNAATRVAALKLGRTESAVRDKAAAEGISLRPTNQSPYTSRKSEPRP